MGLPSIRISPREEDIGTYTLNFYFAELFTNELYFIDRKYEITIVADSADDAEIADDFEEAFNNYQEEIKA